MFPSVLLSPRVPFSLVRAVGASTQHDSTWAPWAGVAGALGFAAAQSQPSHAEGGPGQQAGRGPGQQAPTSAGGGRGRGGGGGGRGGGGAEEDYPPPERPVERNGKAPSAAKLAAYEEASQCYSVRGTIPYIVPANKEESVNEKRYKSRPSEMMKRQAAERAAEADVEDIEALEKLEEAEDKLRRDVWARIRHTYQFDDVVMEGGWDTEKKAPGEAKSADTGWVPGTKSSAPIPFPRPAAPNQPANPDMGPVDPNLSAASTAFEFVNKHITDEIVDKIVEFTVINYQREMEKLGDEDSLGSEDGC